MGILNNNRQEMSCRAMAKGNKSATQCYISVGYSKTGADRNSSRLMKKDGIRARIDELRAASQEKVTVTLESLLVDADRIQKAAEADRSHSAATEAAKLKAELSGIYTQRVKSEATVTQTQSALTNHRRAAEAQSE